MIIYKIIRKIQNFFDELKSFKSDMKALEDEIKETM